MLLELSDLSVALPRVFPGSVLHASPNAYRDKSRPADSGYICHFLTASCGIA